MQRNRVESQAVSERAQELIQIAYRHIVNRGFEGLRVRDVAEEAGINNATLHYYFPTKESLIQGVVEYLMEEFKTNHVPSSHTVPEIPTALDALRREFEDVRYRLREMPEMFIILIELTVRARRDPAIARILSTMEDNWHRHLCGIVADGIQQGIFRPDLDLDATATVLIAQMKALGYQVLGPVDTARVDRLIFDLLAQIEGWLTHR